MSNKLIDVLSRTLNFLTQTKTGKVWNDSNLSISEKVIGGKVEVINSDGTLSPAEDGSYTMDNGDQFEVKDGLITSIAGQEAQAEDVPVEVSGSTSGDTIEDLAVEETPAEGATELPADEVPNEDAEGEKLVADLISNVDSLVATVKVLTERLDSIENGLKQVNMEADSNTKITEQFNATMDNINATLKVLAGKPVEYSKTNNHPKVAEEREENLKDVSRILTELNQQINKK